MTRRSAPLGAEPVLKVEAVAHFKHDGVAHRPGDVVAMSTSEAADLIALGFARPVRDSDGYARRDMKAKG